MCGIIGFFAAPGEKMSVSVLRQTMESLLRLSESRGKEAAGMATVMNASFDVLKAPVSASQLIQSADFAKFFNKVEDSKIFSADGVLNSPIAVIGHSRLMTNGTQDQNVNNQPVYKEHAVCVHNGIIVNDQSIWKGFPSLVRESEVDTEVFVALLEKYLQEKGDLGAAAQEVFQQVEGAASVLVLTDQKQAIWATNTGSLYLCRNVGGSVSILASERFILEQFSKQAFIKKLLGEFSITQIKAGNGYIVDTQTLSMEHIEVALSAPRHSESRLKGITFRPGELPDIKRCTKCILPETMPFIEFDEHGVCNYCRDYEPMQVKPQEELLAFLEPYRSRTGDADCIVAFSGGRDSCYGLHYIKTVLGMNPIAYTYDWGMVTDLARRNQARICGKLGIEHIIVSADINWKRQNIRKNVEAWLKKPDLGMVPLFMAGDKQFYYYANQMKKQTGIKLLFFCAGIPLENTDFKTGFCGIRKGSSKGLLSNLPIGDKVSLALYYGKQYLQNPAYINGSMMDTVFAFFSSYFLGHDYAYLYHYLRWDEKEMMAALIKEYDWELATDTATVWRIGDGTAPFYNYIYNTVAGFTENDTFRSNQIREGMITREEALRLVALENTPRFEAMQEYFDLIGVDMDKALRVVDSIPKLYK